MAAITIYSDFGAPQNKVWHFSAEELMLLNYGAGEDSWEFPGEQGDQTSQS